MNGSNGTADYFKQSYFVEDVTSQADKAVTDHKFAKTKNHPSFTLILRKQLPVPFDIGLASNKCPQNEPNFNQESTFKGTKKVAPSIELRSAAQSKQDFIFANPWQMWILDDNEVIANDWNVRRIGMPARTGREFWSVYQQVHDLFEDAKLMKNLMLFQDSIEPKWEDKANKGGGRWYFDVSYNGRSDGSRRDCLLKSNYWTRCLEIVLSGCLGSLGNLVVGLILHFKPCKYRVSLWIRSCSDFNQVVQLGTQLRNCLNLRCQLKFELHSTTTPSEGVLPRALELN